MQIFFLFTLNNIVLHVSNMVVFYIDKGVDHNGEKL